MKILKSIVMLPFNIIRITVYGFSWICSTTAKGFYFFFVSFFSFFKKLFKSDGKVINGIINHFKKRQGQPEFLMLLLVYLMAGCTVYNVFYPKTTETVTVDDYISAQDSGGNKVTDNNGTFGESSDNYLESNLYRRYGSTDLKDVDFSGLKKDNSDTVAWLSVDGTNINYPIVQTEDNDYYLNHSFDKSSKKSGWTFMDYRNNYTELDKNTIFYGHNLLNKTGFGSLSNLFTSSWLKSSSKNIVLLTESKRYVFKIFSIYTIDPEIYYLQNEFNSDSEYSDFINTIASRNTVNLGESVSADDKIITLSTCTEDNKGRKVIHAKLVSEI